MGSSGVGGGGGSVNGKESKRWTPTTTPDAPTTTQQQQQQQQQQRPPLLQPHPAPPRQSPPRQSPPRLALGRLSPRPPLTTASHGPAVAPLAPATALDVILSARSQEEDENWGEEDENWGDEDEDEDTVYEDDEEDYDEDDDDDVSTVGTLSALGLRGQATGVIPTISLAEISRLQTRMAELEKQCRGQAALLAKSGPLLAQNMHRSGQPQPPTSAATKQAVHAMLCRLQPSTLRRALGDLGLGGPPHELAHLSTAVLAARLAAAVRIGEGA